MCVCVCLGGGGGWRLRWRGGCKAVAPAPDSQTCYMACCCRVASSRARGPPQPTHMLSEVLFNNIFEVLLLDNIS
jgi:hypothetical protein